MTSFCPALRSMTLPSWLTAEAFGDDQSGHNGLAKAPARFDHELVGAVEGVAGEEHACAVGVDEL
jgi:hypothetical protein